METKYEKSFDDSLLIVRVWIYLWGFFANLLWPTLPNIPPVWGYPIVGILPNIFTGDIFSTVMTRLFDAAEGAGLSLLGWFVFAHLRPRPRHFPPSIREEC